MTWLSDSALDRLRDVADFPVPPGGRYEIVEPIARGGMGTVYRARDRELGRDVAVKVLSAALDGEQAAARMRQEARVLARLEHPGIVPVYDVGLLDDGRLFYVMKLVLGPRLDEHAAERPLVERLNLFIRIGDAVAFAHAAGVIHRDLKPENVMVGAFGEVLVMDWGVAQAGLREGLRAEGTGLRVGTHGYMAPEQERGAVVDVRADVYALGGLLQFLLGEPAPRALRAIVAKARAESAADRYPDVPSMAADVSRYLAGEPVSACPETLVEQAARLARRHRVAIAIIVTYLAVRYLIAMF